MTNTWHEVTRANPCPLCGKGDWCGRTDDGAVRCMRLKDPPAEWHVVKVCEDGGTVYRLDTDNFATPRSNGNSRSRPNASQKLYDTPERAIAAILKWRSFKGGKYTNSWAYHNVAGAVVFHVARFDFPDGTKQFRPIRPEGFQWVAGDPPGKLPLFQLPRILEAVRQGRRIFVVEGEKCADALWALGLPATTSAHGSSSAKRTDWSPLVGASVVILPDNDVRGGVYADTVAGILSTVKPPAIVRILQLPGLAAKGDIVNYIEGKECHDDDDLRHGIEEMADGTPVWHPSPQPTDSLPDDPGPDWHTIADILVLQRRLVMAYPIGTKATRRFSCLLR